MPTADSCAAAEKRDEIANCERRQGRHGNRKANHCRSAQPMSQLVKNRSYRTATAMAGSPQSTDISVGAVRSLDAERCAVRRTFWLTGRGAAPTRLHAALYLAPAMSLRPHPSRRALAKPSFSVSRAVRPLRKAAHCVRNAEVRVREYNLNGLLPGSCSFSASDATPSTGPHAEDP
jgi:hypothetical protein